MDNDHKHTAKNKTDFPPNFCAAQAPIIYKKEKNELQEKHKFNNYVAVRRLRNYHETNAFRNIFLYFRTWLVKYPKANEDKIQP